MAVPAVHSTPRFTRLDRRRRVGHNQRMTTVDFEDDFGNNGDWRGAAINACLEASGNEGVVTSHLLLSRIRRHRPNAFTLMLHLDRIQMLKYCRRQGYDFHSLVPGGSISMLRGETCPYVGWYALEWRGTPVEVTLAPGSRIHSAAIVACDDEDALTAFGDVLVDYTIRPEGRSLAYTRLWESAPDIDAEIGSVT